MQNDKTATLVERPLSAQKTILTRRCHGGPGDVVDNVDYDVNVDERSPRAKRMIRDGVAPLPPPPAFTQEPAPCRSAIVRRRGAFHTTMPGVLGSHLANCPRPSLVSFAGSVGCAAR
jgi:hypothetical protein